jgi:hypothetical protein
VTISRASVHTTADVQTRTPLSIVGATRVQTGARASRYIHKYVCLFDQSGYFVRESRGGEGDESQECM